MKLKKLVFLIIISLVNSVIIFFITAPFFSQKVLSLITRFFKINLSELNLFNMSLDNKQTFIYFNFIVIVLLITALISSIPLIRDLLLSKEIENLRNLTSEEEERIFPLFSEIIEKINLKHENKYGEILKRIELKIACERQIQAYAIGKYIALSEEALRKLTDGELKAFLTHEVSHVLNKDVEFSICKIVILKATGMLINLFFWITYMVKNIIVALSRISDIFSIFFLIVRAIEFFIQVLDFIKERIISALILEPLLMRLSRSDEYRCDFLAVDLGYGDDLISGFKKLEVGDEREGSYSVADFFYSTHPKTNKRIERIERIFEVGYKKVKTEVMTEDLKRFAVITAFMGITIFIVRIFFGK